MAKGLGLIAKKAKMTRVFTEEGESIPVTLLVVEPNRVSQIKTLDKEGYTAIQLASGATSHNKLNKAQAGHFSAASVEPSKKLFEFRVNEEQSSSFKQGDVIDASFFSEGQYVDVTGTSIGKGFAGTIKRHNFSSQRNSHGNSLSHRAPGSIGNCQTPGRVFKGKKMSGHLGNEKVTIQNLQVVKVDKDRGVLLVKGAVPGSTGSHLYVYPSLKKSGESK